jgi:hypothetical protein
MEPNLPGLPSPEEIDDATCIFIRQRNDHGITLRQQHGLYEAIVKYSEVLAVKSDVPVIHNSRAIAWL